MDVPDPRSISSFEPAGFLFLLLRFLLFLRFCDLLFMIKISYVHIILNLFNSQLRPSFFLTFYTDSKCIHTGREKG